MEQQFGIKNNLIFILVKPQLGENIGAVARVMFNFGLTELRIIAPRDPWPNEKAYSIAVGGKKILDYCSIYNSLAESLKDIEYIYASTIRNRFIWWKIWLLTLI